MITLTLRWVLSDEGWCYVHRGDEVRLGRILGRAKPRTNLGGVRPSLVIQ